MLLVKYFTNHSSGDKSKENRWENPWEDLGVDGRIILNKF
jgi:hypothetical protein